MDATTVASIVSGILIAAIGAGVLAAPRRRAAGVFFALYCILWGLEIAVVNGADLVADEHRYLVMRQVGIALLIPETLFLVHFAVRWHEGVQHRSRAWTVAAAAVGATAALVFLTNPLLFVATDSYGAGLAAAALVYAPSYAALYLAVAILAARYVRTSDALSRRELAIALAALGLYLAYATPFYLLYYAGDYAESAAVVGPAATWLYLGTFIVGSAVLAALVAVLLRGARRRGPAGRQDAALCIAVVGAAVLGVLSAVPQVWGAEALYVFALPRVAAAALLAYGMLKHRLFGLDLRLKRGIRGSIIAGAFGIAFFAADQAGQFLVASVTGSALIGVATAALLLVVFAPLKRVAARVSDAALPDVDDSESYRRRRSLDVYRSALAEVARGGITPREAALLTRLREQLGIDEATASSLHP